MLVTNARRGSSQQARHSWLPSNLITLLEPHGKNTHGCSDWLVNPLTTSSDHLHSSLTLTLDGWLWMACCHDHEIRWYTCSHFLTIFRPVLISWLILVCPLPETSAFDFRLHNPNHDFTRDSSLNIVCCHKSYVSLTPTSGEVVDPPPIQSLGVPPVQSALSVATLERPQ